MTLIDLCDAIQKTGATCHIHGAKLLFGPAGAIPKKLYPHIAKHKARMVQLIKSHYAYCVFTHPDQHPETCAICRPEGKWEVRYEAVEAIWERAEEKQGEMF